MSEVAIWPDARFPLQVGYSRDALEKIRATALEGLMSLPRIGVGVGGLLIGERSGDAVNILGSVEIPCSHSLGASFALTPDEQDFALELIRESGQDRVIGWFVSKGLRALELSETDDALLRALFPQGWSIGLLVQSQISRPTRIAFVARDASGSVVTGVEGDLAQERADAPEAVPTTPPPPPPPAPVIPQVTQPVLVQPEKPVPETFAAAKRERAPQRIVPAAKAVPNRATATRPGSHAGLTPLDERRLFNTLNPGVSSGTRWIRLTLAVAATVVVALTGIYFSRPTQTAARGAPGPSLILNVSEERGSLLIRWNREAVEGSGQGVMFIDDGGRLHSVALTRTQLNSGEFRYSPSFPHVTAIMTVGELKAEASFTSPAGKRKQNRPLRRPSPDGSRVTLP